MKTFFCALHLIPVLVSAREDVREFVSREIPWGRAVALAEFGGPDLEVGVRARQMTYVLGEIVDHTRLVPVARAIFQGVIVDPTRNTASVIANPDAKMVPMRTTVRVEKKRGVTLPGSNKEMYLLFHEPESGISVYFLDAIARQNHDHVVIAIPRAAAESEGKALRLSEPGSASPVIPELVEWHQRLLDERRTLDVGDRAAVARFNQHAADYHGALQKMRAAREAMQQAPRGSPR